MKSRPSNKLAFVTTRSTAAYTLFEIMLVLSIIAVLTGGAIFMIINNIDVA